jgi:hypothetical protein
MIGRCFATNVIERRSCGGYQDGKVLRYSLVCWGLAGTVSNQITKGGGTSIETAELGGHVLTS